MGMTFKTARIIAISFLTIGISAALTGCATETEVPGDTAVTGQEAPPTEHNVKPEPAQTPAECLIGSWQLRNETFEQAIAGMMQDSPDLPAEMRGSMSIRLRGASLVRFGPDGDYGAWQDDYSIIVGSELDNVRHTQNSADVARYEVQGDRLHVREFQQLFVEAEMTVGEGIRVSVPAGNDSMASISFFGYTANALADPRELPDGSAQFVCNDTLLKLQVDGSPSAVEFDRVADIKRS